MTVDEDRQRILLRYKLNGKRESKQINYKACGYEKAMEEANQFIIYLNLQCIYNNVSYNITQYTLDRAKQLGVVVKPSTSKNKKIDVFKNGSKVASVGALGYGDYSNVSAVTW